MRPAKMARTRKWPRRNKPASRIVAGFPWETVFKFLVDHPRSMILMHMVDKNLRFQLINDHRLWTAIFKRHVYRIQYVFKRVDSAEFPGLRLFKSGLHGVPVHTGPIKGDKCQDPFPPDFDEIFTRYVRKAFGLMYGQRCGLCGCRYHHEVYWSLRMRVCKLCMAGNTITTWELFHKYGVHYTDIVRTLVGKVFFFYMPMCVGQDRMPSYSSRTADLTYKRSMLVLWLPHLERILHLPDLHRQQQARRAGAQRLCAVFRRLWIYHLRSEYAKKGLYGRRSIDNLMMMLYHMERKRVAERYHSQTMLDTYTPGACEWAFLGSSRCGTSRHQKLNGSSKHSIYNLIDKWEDTTVHASQSPLGI